MRRPVIAMAVLVLFAAACSSDSVSGPPAYELREFAIDGPSRASSGPSTVSVVNSGEFAHTLVISDETGRVVAATDLIQPGETVGLEVSLPPGEFQFTCRIVAETPGGEIVDHFEAGMSQTVVVES